MKVGQIVQRLSRHRIFHLPKIHLKSYMCNTNSNAQLRASLLINDWSFSREFWSPSINRGKMMISREIVIVDKYFLNYSRWRPDSPLTRTRTSDTVKKCFGGDSGRVRASGGRVSTLPLKLRFRLSRVTDLGDPHSSRASADDLKNFLYDWYLSQREVFT